MCGFSSVLNRFGSNALKWDVQKDEIPMWIADMDFQAAPAIIRALEKRVQHGIFGYNVLPDEYYEAIQNWWKTYHGFDIKREWIVFASNVIPSISSVIRAFSQLGDNVLLLTPVYHTFFHCIEANERKVLESLLVYQNGQYEIDFDDMESKLAHPQTKIMILCNPHNPMGKIWNKEELQRIAALCVKHDVLVIADEIHCDIVAPHAKNAYIPFASVCGECLSVSAWSVNKAFNTAGIQGSFNVITNQTLREKLQEAFVRDEIATPNCFTAPVTIAALTQSREWLESLNAYVDHNKHIATEFIEQKIGLHVIRGEASYLLWVDCSPISHDSVALCDFIRQHARVYLSEGKQFGGNGHDFIRINVACPLETLQEGLKRFEKGVAAFRAK